MKLLLLSNSTIPGQEYLEYSKQEIQNFLGEKPVTAVFIPYAAVTFSYDEYCEKVEKSFAESGHHIKGIHTFPDPVKAIEKAEAIVVGGGNTWQLVRKMHDKNLMYPIREKVFNQTPYIGWSAGSNVACPTLCTTNDMPIVDPKGFECIGLVPFQINPHYLDANPEGHGGETREQRIQEFMVLNPDIFVVGLREGTMLKLTDGKLQLIGNRHCRVFKNGEKPLELAAEDDCSFLQKSGFANLK